jgi:hypothetical protein
VGFLVPDASAFDIYFDEATSKITLSPLVQIPKSIMDSIDRGLAQSKEGKVQYLGSFQNYLDDDK